MRIAEKDMDFLVFNTNFDSTRRSRSEDVLECQEYICDIPNLKFGDDFLAIVEKVGLTNPEYSSIIPFFHLEAYEAILNNFDSSEFEVVISKNPFIYSAKGVGKDITDSMFDAVFNLVYRCHPEIKNVKLWNTEVGPLGAGANGGKKYAILEFWDKKNEKKWISVGFGTDIAAAVWDAIFSGVNHFLLKLYEAKAEGRIEFAEAI